MVLIATPAVLYPWHFRYYVFRRYCSINNRLWLLDIIQNNRIRSRNKIIVFLYRSVVNSFASSRGKYCIVGLVPHRQHIIISFGVIRWHTLSSTGHHTHTHTHHHHHHHHHHHNQPTPTPTLQTPTTATIPNTHTHNTQNDEMHIP